MHLFLERDHLAVLLVSLVQFVLFLRWLYRRIRNDEIQHAFVEDIARNHLPHIYDALRRLCQQEGIPLDDSPPIRWVDLNNHQS